MLEKQYDFAVDIWSLGCILAELLSGLQNQVSQKRPSSVLFRGAWCFPLSPKPEIDFQEKLYKDQMEAIIRKIGFPNAED